MNRLSRLLPIATMSLVVAVHAQPVTAPPPPTYRSVGPDGKIVFSDRKPTDPQLQTRQLGQTVRAPLLMPASGPYDLHPATTMAPPPRLADGVAPPVDVGGRPFPPGLPEAVFDVVIHQFFAQSLVETCPRLRPAQADRYQAAVRNWRDRNADLLARSNRIQFSRFTGEQRDTLRATGRARLGALLPASDATEAERVEWCERTLTDLARRQFELVGDARLAPILVYAGP